MLSARNTRATLLLQKTYVCKMEIKTVLRHGTEGTALGNGAREVT